MKINGYNKWQLAWWSFVFTIMLTSFSSHAQSGPTNLNVTGALYLPSGSPVTQSGVNFRLEIWDKSSTCLLYTEQHLNEDLSQTKGGFSLAVGKGTSAQNYIDGNSVLSSKVFENYGVQASVGPSCPAGANFASGDERVIRVSYDLGGGFVAMSPDVPIASSAYAVVAETLQGKRPSDFVQLRDDGTHDLNQANVENVFSSTNYARLQELLAPTSPIPFSGVRLTGVADPSAAQDAATKNYTDTKLAGQTIDLVDVAPGFGGGKVLTWDQAANKWVAMAPNISGTAGGDLTGTYPNPQIANLAIGTSKIQDNAISSAKIQTTGLAANRLLITDATTGATVTYKTCGSDEILKFTTGVGWECASIATYSAVTSVNTKTGAVVLTGADLGLGSASMRNIGIGASNVPDLDGGGKLAASTIPNFSGDITGAYTNAFVARLQGQPISATAPNTNEVLKWNGSRWEPTLLTDNVGITALNGDVTAAGTGLVSATIVNNAITTPKVFATPGANRLVATDNTSGATLVPFVCNLDETMKWTASGWGCITVGNLLGNQFIVDGGNARGAAISIGTSDNNDLRLITNGQARISIGNTGYVGIGMTNPSSSLHIAGDSVILDNLSGGTSIKMRGSGASINYYSNYDPANTNNDKRWKITAISEAFVTATRRSDFDFQFWNGGSFTNNVTFKANGSVGIGVTDPIEKFEVAGKVKGTQLCIGTDCKSAWPADAGGDFKADGTVPMGGQFRSIAGSAGAPGITFVGDTDNGLFAPAADNLAIATSGTEKLRVLANGKIGIGTTNPTQLLTLEGSLTGADRTMLLLNNTDASSGQGATLKVQSNGVVGSLGTSGGGYSTVAGFANGTYLHADSSVGHLGLSAPAAGGYIRFLTAGLTNSEERMRIDSTGQVGIGTQTPGAPLDVRGIIRSTGAIASVYTADLSVRAGLNPGATGNGFLFAKNASLNETVRFNSYGDSYLAGGNVGIGTTTPSRLLEVAGSIRIQPAALPGSPVAGDMAFDSAASNALKYHNGTNWVTIGSGSGDFLANGTVPMTGALQHIAGSAGAPGMTFVGDTDNGIFAPAADNLAIATSGTEKLRVLANGNVGIGTTSPGMKLTVNGDGGILALGTNGSGATLAESGAGTRLIWYPRKSAFRAGATGGTSWDDANIGAYSTAMGYSTTASNSYSTAMGYSTTASGSNSIATGSLTTASGNSSTAMGELAVASGANSTAIGYGTTASSSYTLALGRGAVASGSYSVAIGKNPTASGSSAFAFGDNASASNGNAMALGSYATASGNYSASVGSYSTASGDFSTTLGARLTSPSQSQITVGYYNADTGSENGSSWVATDPLFVVGNGVNSSSKSNALMILKNGNVGIGTTAPSRLLQVAGTMKLSPASIPGSPTAGDIFIDSGGANALKYYNGSAWVSVGSGSGDFLANGTVPMTGALQHIAGSAGAPGMTFVGDTDNGIFAPAADNLAIATSGTEKLRVLANGNVGIGTTAPTTSLDVNGNIRFSTSIQGGSATANALFGAASGAYFQVFGNNYGTASQRGGAEFVFDTRNSGTGGFSISGYDGATWTNYFKVATTGTVGVTNKLGVGTMSPPANFSIYDASDAALSIQSAISSRTWIAQSSAANALLIGGTGASRPLDSAFPLTIHSAGNVGIGTTAPSRLLDVGGPIHLAPAALPSSPAAGDLAFDSAASNALKYHNGTSWVALGSGTGDFLANGSVSMTGNLRLNNNWLSGDGGNEGIFVSSNGNVGMGTTGPTTNLEVTSTAWPTIRVSSTTANGGTLSLKSSTKEWQAYLATNDLKLWDGTDRVTFQSGGNVGIGVTNPTRLLHVAGAMKLAPVSTPSSPTAGDIFIDSGGANALKYYNGSAWVSVGSGSGDFKADGSVPMTGNFRLNNNWLSGDGGNEGVFVAADGKVGIGTSSPSFRLDLAATNEDAKITVQNFNSTTARYPGFLVSNYMGSANAGMPVILTYNRRGNSGAPLAVQSGDGLGVIQFSGGSDSSYGILPGASISAIAEQNFSASAAGTALVLQTTSLGGTANTEKMRISANGNVGIGTTNPRTSLDVAGAFTGNPAVSNAGTTINFMTGNSQYTSLICQNFTLWGMKDGGSYTFAVQNTNSATCSFTAYSDSGSTLLTFHLPPDHAATDAGKHTIYSFIVLGTHVYASWITGY